MVPSNFKQNVKENANLAIGEGEISNNCGIRIYCRKKVNFS
jgi:hypothetical protein